MSRIKDILILIDDLSRMDAAHEHPHKNLIELGSKLLQAAGWKRSGSDFPSAKNELWWTYDGKKLRHNDTIMAVRKQFGVIR